MRATQPSTLLEVLSRSNLLVFRSNLTHTHTRLTGALRRHHRPDAYAALSAAAAVASLSADAAAAPHIHRCSQTPPPLSPPTPPPLSPPTPLLLSRRRCSSPQGKYKGDVNQIYSDDPTSHPIIDEALWNQASGGSKKGRIYGFGNTSDPNLVLTGVPSGGYASGASSSDTRIQALETRLQQSEHARENDLEEMHRKEEVLMKEMAEMCQIEEVRKEYQDMMDLVKKLSQSQFTPSQFPPPLP